MNRFRIPRADFLAITRARQAVALDAGIDAPTTRRLLSVNDTLVASVKVRARHLGLLNGLIEKMIDEGHIDGLPGELQDQLADLFAAGINLAVEDSGLSGGLW